MTITDSPFDSASTPIDSAFELLPEPIASALTSRGFTTLTSVQQAVLDPALAGLDLRISSQTGSGKTVAVGLVVVPDLERAVQARASGDSEAPASGMRPAPPAARSKASEESGADAPPPPPAPRARAGAARPAVLLIAPTRELAVQLSRELTWLFAPLNVRVCVVTGGTSIPVELRALRNNPLVVVGTPGRLVDHLERGAIDPSSLTSVVLDEADQMLDLGFRDELSAILDRTPAERRTHLVSATFPREVLALADRYQRDATHVSGTKHGDANVDIAHTAHLVLPSERDAALRNLLLLVPGERALVFVRTRADANDLADRLSGSGFSARALHGDMEQRERTRTLDAFRSGDVTTLIATDVAARGLDITDVGRVIHADPPGDSEVLTHRSGRTGRAGRKGMSIVLVPPAARESVQRLFRRARVEATWRPAPSPADVFQAADDRLRAELLASVPASPAGASADSSADAPASSPASLLAGAEAAEALDPRLRSMAEELLSAMDPVDLVTALLARAGHAGPCEPLPVKQIELPAPSARSHAGPGRAPARGGSFAPFRINWGERDGADARRILAMICRRGNIRSDQVGAIRIGEVASTFEVASDAAAEFARAVKKPDARDRRIRIDAMGPSTFRSAAHPAARSTTRPAGRPAAGAPRRSPPAPSAPSAPPAHGHAPPARRSSRVS